MVWIWQKKLDGLLESIDEKTLQSVLNGTSYAVFSAKEELKKIGYNKMINGCLKGNSANEFYKHMGGKLVDTGVFKVKNGQEIEENIYYYDKTV